MEQKKKKTSVSVMLSIGFGTLIVFSCIIAVYSLIKIEQSSNTLQQINEINSLKQRYAIDFRGSVHDRSIDIRDVVLSSDSQKLNDIITDIKRLQENYRVSEQNMSTNFIQKGLFDSEEQTIYGNIEKTKQTALPLIDKTIQYKQNGQDEEALRTLQQVAPYFVTWLAQINQFIDLEENKNQTLTKQLYSSISTFEMWIYILVVLSVIIGLSIAISIIRELFRSLGGEPYIASRIVTKIANGNLSDSIAFKGQESMLASIAAMQNKLKEIIQAVIQSSLQINQATDEVSKASHEAQNSSNIQTQSSSAIVARINEVNTLICGIANAAKLSEENAMKNAELSSKGMEVINSTAEEIGKATELINSSATNVRGLQQQSLEISTSANLIAEIADQTNLLALNAAIEAARAGEHGRGFAVVAEEVRKLAEKTAASTNEITRIIQLIQNGIESSVSSIELTVPQIEKGRELIANSVSLLNQIHEQTHDSLLKAQEMAKTSDQQESTMQTITQDIQSISTLSINTGKTLQDTNATIEKLQEVAHILKKHMEFFKV